MSLLGIGQLEPETVASLVKVAAEVKQRPEAVAGTLAGRAVGLFFMKPSTRTRVSAEVATRRLGADPIVLRDDEVGLGTRESVADVARVLDRFLDLLALRVFDHSHLEQIDAYTRAPVVNLLSDLEHPCQALGDLQTMAEVRSLPGSVLAYVGDGNNVCHSLMLGAAMMRMEVRLACPEGFTPRPALLELARRHGSVTVSHDPASAVRGAHFVYTDVWASMGQEEEAAARRAVFEPFRVDRDLFALADREAAFLHCLPAHRDEEVTDAVMDHPRSRVFDQAENRLHSFAAVLLHLLG